MSPQRSSWQDTQAIQLDKSNFPILQMRKLSLQVKWPTQKTKSGRSGNLSLQEINKVLEETDGNKVKHKLLESNMEKGDSARKIMSGGTRDFLN